MRRQLVAFLDAVAHALRACMVSRTASVAVEFAIVLPVALGLYIGAAEVTQGVMTSRKVNQLTRTLVDLLSQQGTTPVAAWPQNTSSSPPPGNAVTAAQLSTLMNAAQTLLSPQPTTTLKMTLTAVDVAANQQSGVCCVATVRWSYTQGGTLRPCGTLSAGPDGQTNSPTTMSTSLLPSGSVLVAPMAILIADVNYTYQPVVQTSLVPFAPSFSRIEYMYPRAPGQVIAGPLPASGTQYGKGCY